MKKYQEIKDWSKVSENDVIYYFRLEDEKDGTTKIIPVQMSKEAIKKRKLEANI